MQTSFCLRMGEKYDTMQENALIMRYYDGKRGLAAKQIE